VLPIQSSHTRSADAVAAVPTYFPATQTVAVAHSAPSLVLEKFVSTTHAVHARSAVAVPSVSRPCPTSHVACAAHSLTTVVMVLALDLNVSSAQSVHVRSTEALAATLVYVPAAQTALVAVQAVPSSIVEWYPVWHAVHVRSVVVLPSPVLPSPAGQVFHAAQEDWPVVAVKVPEAQSTQSVCAAVSWCLPMAHAVQASASPLEAAAVLRFFPAAQEMQAVRSVESWYCPVAQSVQVVKPTVGWNLPLGHDTQ
jgi:hypothetical protein